MSKYSYIPLKPGTKALLEERLGRSDTWDAFIHSLAEGGGGKVKVVEKEVLREVRVDGSGYWDKLRIWLEGNGKDTSLKMRYILKEMDRLEGE